jgi:hypothetical protein
MLGLCAAAAERNRHEKRKEGGRDDIEEVQGKKRINLYNTLRAAKLPRQ